MKIQRILTATIRSEKTGGILFQIVLAFTEGRGFVVWDHNKEVGYFNHDYFTDFNGAYNGFNNRCSPHGQAAYDSIEYCARQIGQAEIIWEELN